MDLWDIGRIVIKRWYVTLPLAVATVLLAMLMGGRVNPEYSAETSLLLLAPGTTEDSFTTTTVLPASPDATDSANPYLSFPSSLTTMAEATQLSVSSDSSRSMIAAEGLLPGYEVAAQDRSPLLFVRVSSTDEEATLATMDRVVELVETDLEERQEAGGVPTEQRIIIEVLARSQVGSADAGGKTQVRLTVLGLGALCTIGAAVIFDALVTRRRRGADDDEADGEGADDDHTDFDRPDYGSTDYDRPDYGSTNYEDADDEDPSSPGDPPSALRSLPRR